LEWEEEEDNWYSLDQVPTTLHPGAPFDVFPLPAVTQHKWNLLVLIRFLLRLMTSQTSGAGQEATGLGVGPGITKFKNCLMP
jgi:hypothetical protein